jgi:hypothetical protein
MNNIETRLKLLSDYVSLANNLGSHCLEKAKTAPNETSHNRYVFIAYSLLSVVGMSDLVLRGAHEKNDLLIFSGLRMLEENIANLSYVFHDEAKTDVYISSILSRGLEYQQAYTELRYNPDLGMKHLNAVARWSNSTITQRIERLGEGPEFRYAMACKYLHSDIWTMLNNQAIEDKNGILYGLTSWAVEDVSNMISVIRSDEALEPEYGKIYDELVIRLEEDFQHEPTQTYRNA